MGVEGRTLGNYVLEAEIGRGGMGVVYRARQPLLDRLAVLKKVRRELAELPDFAERFAREARAAGAIHHPNVVAVYDHFTWRGDHYIAQEYVDGVDLEAANAKTGALPWRVAVAIAVQLARGLEAIHASGTVHRDVKPSNILVGRGGEVKIADFGVALQARCGGLTQPGTVVGTPPYLSPEQLRGIRVDHRSDLFSLGAVLYELLAGKPPYAEPAENEIDALLAAMDGEHVGSLRAAAPGAPGSLRRLTKRLLRAKPQKRVSSTREVRARLESILGPRSDAAMRELIADHFFARKIFVARPGETRVLERARIVRIATLARVASAAVLTMIVIASTLVIDVRPIPPKTTAREAARARAIDPRTSQPTREMVAEAFDPMRTTLGTQRFDVLAGPPPVFAGEAFAEARRQLEPHRLR